MSRLLFFIAVAVAIWLLLRGTRRAQVRDAAPSRERVEDMVACARCGVNMPKSEAREQAGAYYCRDNPRCA